MSLLSLVGLDNPTALSMTKLIIEVCLKSILVIAAFALIAVLMRKSSASLRSILWASALCVLLLLPIVSFNSALWSIPILSEFGPEPTAETIRYFEQTRFEKLSSFLGEISSSQDSKAIFETLLSSSNQDTKAAAATSHWSQWVLLAWFTGAGLITLWFGISRVSGLFLVARAQKVDDPAWVRTLEETKKELGIHRPVRLLSSSFPRIAMTCGIIKPTIMLPASYVDWPETRSKVVLMHELAHIKRLDSLVDVLGKASLVLHWFNPLVWKAVKQLRVERERASDDMVITSGAKPSEYASQLMQVAADFGSRPRPVWQVLTISEGSSLKDRLLCILDPKVNRKSHRLIISVAIAVLLVLLVVPLSAFNVWEGSSLDMAGMAAVSNGQMNVKTMVNGLASKNPEFKNASAENLLKTDRSNFDKIVYLALQHENEDVRREALDILFLRDERLVLDYLKQYTSKSNKAFAYVGNMELQRLKNRKTVQNLINNLGYKHLEQGNISTAVELLQLNVKAFPESYNAWDSLGEAYAYANNTELSIKCFEQSLKLNASNENAAEMLKWLKKTGSIPEKRTKSAKSK